MKIVEKLKPSGTAYSAQSHWRRIKVVYKHDILDALQCFYALVWFSIFGVEKTTPPFTIPYDFIEQNT